MAYPPAAVESETTAQLPARTGAFDACKTMFVLAACAEIAGITTQANKITVSKNAGKERFWRVAIFVSSNCLKLSAPGRQYLSASQRHLATFVPVC
jgi:hypothetical protein